MAFALLMLCGLGYGELIKDVPLASAPRATSFGDEYAVDAIPWEVLEAELFAEEAEQQIARLGATAEEQEQIEMMGLSVRRRVVRAPQGGVVSSLAEYANAEGLMVSWTLPTFNNPMADFVKRIVAVQAAKVFILIHNQQQYQHALNSLPESPWIELVWFDSVDSNEPWMRDYGPLYTNVDGQVGLVDFTYNRPRPGSNSFIKTLGDLWQLPVYELDLVFTGGNFLQFEDGAAFATDLLLQENPRKSQGQIEQILRQYLGITSLTIYPGLPMSVDDTNHIDMWMMPVSDGVVIVGQFPRGQLGYQETEFAAEDLRARGYRVFRTPSRSEGGGYGSQNPAEHHTYVNAVVLNNHVFIPQYGSSLDATAAGIWQQTAPHLTPVLVDSRQFISMGGSLHCVSAHIMVAGQTPDIRLAMSAAGGGVIPRWGMQGPASMMDATRGTVQDRSRGNAMMTMMPFPSSLPGRMAPGRGINNNINRGSALGIDMGGGGRGAQGRGWQSSSSDFLPFVGGQSLSFPSLTSSVGGPLSKNPSTPVSNGYFSGGASSSGLLSHPSSRFSTGPQLLPSSFTSSSSPYTLVGSSLPSWQQPSRGATTSLSSYGASRSQMNWWV